MTVPLLLQSPDFPLELAVVDFFIKPAIAHNPAFPNIVLPL
jgi:hypothetical protein